MSSSRLSADRVLVVSAALADGTADTVTPGVSLLAEGGVITRMWTGEDPGPPPAGVTVVDGTGATLVPGLVDSHAPAPTPGGGSLRANQLAWEVQALVEAGVAPRTAPAAVTWRGGDLLGIPEAGRLTVGGPAHFSLVHGDPLTDPAALWRVWLTR